MQPINYTGQTYLPPEDGLIRSFGQGMEIRQAYEAAQSKMLERQRAMEMQQQYQSETQAALSNPTPQAFAALALKYPQHREAFKQGWDGLSADAQKNELRDMGVLAASLQAGRTDIATRDVERRIETMKAAGEDVTSLELLRDQIKADPQRAYGSLLQIASGIPGGDKLLENLGRVGQEQRAGAKEQRDAELQPSVLAKSQADANTAVVKSRFVESQAVQDLKLGAAQIEKMAADTEIAKMNSRIAAMNAATSRESNDLKKQELRLKLDEAVKARDDKVREKVGTAQAGAANIDNMLNTIERIKANPRLNDVVGGIRGRTFAIRDDSIDAVALIETLGSQAFLAQIPNIKGMGALSNAEGEKLQSALQNLSRTQSETQFRKNLDEAARLLNKGRATLAKSSGIDLGRPDTPAAPGGRPPLSSFQR